MVMVWEYPKEFISAIAMTFLAMYVLYYRKIRLIESVIVTLLYFIIAFLLLIL